MTENLAAAASEQAKSLLATALTANPIADAVVIGALTVIIGGIVGGEYAYKRYEEYMEEKHREEIEAVNKIYRDTLTNIKVLGINIHLPPIFSLIKPENESGEHYYDSLHMIEEEVDGILNEYAELDDPALREFNESIRNATLTLQYYYLDLLKRKKHPERKHYDKEDIIEGVLSWLMNTLENHCQYFKGYALDLAMLNAIEKFISVYKSSDNTEKSELFSRLSEADGYLINAIDLLKSHRKSLTLKDYTGEMAHACRIESDKLLRIFTELTVPNDLQRLVRFAPFPLLATGVLRPGYYRNRFWGTTWKAPVLLPKPKETFLSSWLQYMSKLRVASSTLSPPLGEILRNPNAIFHLPHNIAIIQKAFEINANFLTRDHKIDSMVKVKSPVELINRATVFQDLATLICQVISLTLWCEQLDTYYQQLGSIYVNNPDHLERFFHIADALGKQILETAIKVENATEHYLKDIDLQKRMDQFRTLPQKILENIVAIRKTVKNNLAEVQAAHQKSRVKYTTEGDSKLTGQSLRDMIHMCEIFEKTYNIAPLPGSPSSTFTSGEKKEFKEDLLDEKMESQPLMQHNKESSHTSQDSCKKHHQEATMQLCDLIGRIITLNESGVSFALINAWFDLYHALTGLLEESIRLKSTDEKTADAKRIERFQVLSEMTVFLTLQANELIKIEKTPDFNTRAAPIRRQIRNEISHQTTRHLINYHPNWFLRNISFLPFSVFHQPARRAMDRTETAFSRLYRAESAEQRNVHAPLTVRVNSTR